MYYVYFKYCFRLFVIIEHNRVVFSRFFLICLRRPMLELFLTCSYFGPNIEARCSYKIVLIFKKKRVFLFENLSSMRSIPFPIMYLKLLLLLRF